MHCLLQGPCIKYLRAGVMRLPVFGAAQAMEPLVAGRGRLAHGLSAQP